MRKPTQPGAKPGLKPALKPALKPVAGRRKTDPVSSGSSSVVSAAPVRDQGPPPWYKRKYLIYPQFQMTLIIVNSFITIFLFSLTVLLVVKSHVYLETVIRQSRLPAQNLFIQLLTDQLRSLLIYMGIATFFGVLITAVVTLLLSHKLAGPMIKLRRYFSQIESSGNFSEDLSFRETDFFLDLPPTINKALHALKKKWQ